MPCGGPFAAACTVPHVRPARATARRIPVVVPRPVLRMPHVVRLSRSIAALGLAGALLVAGCDGPDAALAPAAPTIAPARSLAADATPRLLACAEATPRATSGLVGLLGGVLSLGATHVEFPLMSVLELQLFSLAVQPGPHAMVDVHADGLLSFLFRRPVTVTIDLSHCPAIDGPLTVWHVDEATGAFLENMGGVVDPVRRTITFQTPHLSIYAVAN